MEAPESLLKDADQQSSSGQSEPAGSVTVADGKEDTTRSSDRAREAGGGGETASKFYCYICNITCHNQQVNLFKLQVHHNQKGKPKAPDMDISTDVI